MRLLQHTLHRLVPQSRLQQGARIRQGDARHRAGIAGRKPHRVLPQHPRRHMPGLQTSFGRSEIHHGGHTHLREAERLHQARRPLRNGGGNLPQPRRRGQEPGICPPRIRHQHRDGSQGQGGDKALPDGGGTDCPRADRPGQSLAPGGSSGA